MPSSDDGPGGAPRCTCPNRNRHDTRHLDTCPVAAWLGREFDAARERAASLAGHDPQTCQRWYGMPDCTCGAEAPGDLARAEHKP